MRILATTTGGAGHFGPMAVVLQACAVAGHELLVACPRSFAGQVRGAGLPCAPFDDVAEQELGRVFARLPGLSYEESNRIVVREVFATLDVAAALPGLTATFASWRPAVVLREPAEFAGWVLAERASVPQVRVAVSLLASERRLAEVAAPAVAAVAGPDGLAPDPGGRRLSAGPVLASAPAAFDPPGSLGAAAVHRFGSARPTPGPLPGPVPEGDEPLVYVTFGTVGSTVGLWPAAYTQVVEALADTEVRALVTTGYGVDASALGPLPPRVTVADFVPQDAVLPHAAVMVTHGGYGTVLGGLRAGVPMVVTPMFADQRENAQRVAAVGAGVHVEMSPQPMDLSPGWGAAVRAAVLGLLDDHDARAAADRLAEEMAAHPPVASAVDVIASAGQG